MTRQDSTPRHEVWDPFGTLRNALWIDGGQRADAPLTTAWAST